MKMPLKGYKTLAFAALVAVSGFLASPEVSYWVTDNLPWATTGLGVVIAALRAATSSPMFKKDAGTA